MHAGKEALPNTLTAFKLDGLIERIKQLFDRVDHWMNTPVTMENKRPDARVDPDVNIEDDLDRQVGRAVRAINVDVLNTGGHEPPKLNSHTLNLLHWLLGMAIVGLVGVCMSVISLKQQMADYVEAQNRQQATTDHRLDNLERRVFRGALDNE
ncbi:MAG TPA: hypothetical protein VGL72_30510 [Bryobacteraceae bacterium]|jgi:hypothetical protein